MTFYTRVILLTIFLLQFFRANAQESNTYIIGYVKDEVIKEGVEGALVYEKSLQKGVETDENGFFQLSVNPGVSLVVIIRRVGYDLASVQLDPVKDGEVKKLDISLNLKDAGKGVTIYAESIGDKIWSGPMYRNSNYCLPYPAILKVYCLRSLLVRLQDQVEN